MPFIYFNLSALTMNSWFKMKAQQGEKRKEKKLCILGGILNQTPGSFMHAYVYISLLLCTFRIYACAVSGHAY